jgi:outer membrane lipoprotein carrier protein
MRSNLLILSIILFIISGCWIPAFANQADADELKQLLANIHTFQADFKQMMVNSSQKTTNKEEAHGKMYLERPGKFRWESTAITKQVIVANNNLVYIYDEDLNQVIKRKINFRDPANPAILLSGSIESLQQVFLITKTKQADADTWFTLKPKNKNNMYRFIKLHFQSNRLLTMAISDNLGQQSEIQFQHAVTDAPLNPNLFIFVIPKDADVIEGE